MTDVRSPSHGISLSEPTPSGTRCADPAEVLRGTARYLVRHGWVNDGWHRPQILPARCCTDPAGHPRACVMGAIEIVVTGRPRAVLGRLAVGQSPVAAWIAGLAGANLTTVCAAADAIAAYLTDRNGYAPSPQGPIAQVVDWNDEDGQNAANVARTLRAAADYHPHRIAAQRVARWAVEDGAYHGPVSQ